MRKLRMTGETDNRSVGEEMMQPDVSKTAERKLRKDNKEIFDKVSRLFAMEKALAARKAEFKKDISKVEGIVNDLRADILSFCSTNEIDKLTGERFSVEVTDKVSRRIDPELFLKFLSAHNKTKNFYDFVTVPIGSASSHFGEAVLDAAGVIQSSVTKYSGLKIKEIA